jgi:hypothetical protein
MRVNNSPLSTAHLMPKLSTYPATPELDKMKAVKDKSQTLGEFIEWLQSEKKVHLGAPHVHGPTCAGWDADREKYSPRGGDRCECSTGEFIPFNFTMERLLAEFFEIDLVKVENERRTILAYIRKEKNCD